MKRTPILAAVVPDLEKFIRELAEREGIDARELSGRFIQVGVEAWRADKDRWNDLILEQKRIAKRRT